MKPWENVKRERQRRKLIGYGVATLVVIGAILAVSNLGGSSPTSRPIANTPQSRNAERKAELESLAAALRSYRATHAQVPVTIPTSDMPICSSATPACKADHMLDMNFLLTNDTGLSSIPSDPVGGPGKTSSGYVARQQNGVIVLAAPRAEDGKAISVSVK